MSLRGTLDVAAATDAVEFAFTVENDGDAAVEVRFPNGQVADVEVSPRGSDDPVWRWSDDRMFTQALQTESLEPGETLRREFTWDEPEPGSYVAVASLAGSPSAEATTSFEI